MGNYDQLKQSVSDVIKTNGNQEITGSTLQNVLLTIISTVGANATFAGVATPATNPGTHDGPVFYLASEGGTYSNFGSVELQDGLSVLMWNGSWSSQQIFGVDDVPTAGSNNPVKSSGVQQELALGAVYDVSAKNPTAGPNNDGKFESLSTLLRDTNLNTLIPTSVRKGGMSIKFVQSSDNMYVQYRYLGTDVTGTPNPFLNIGNWDNLADDLKLFNIVNNAVISWGGEYIGNIESNNGYDVIWAKIKEGEKRIKISSATPQIISWYNGRMMSHSTYISHRNIQENEWVDIVDGAVYLGITFDKEKNIGGIGNVNLEYGGISNEITTRIHCVEDDIIPTLKFENAKTAPIHTVSLGKYYDSNGVIRNNDGYRIEYFEINIGDVFMVADILNNPATAKVCYVDSIDQTRSKVIIGNNITRNYIYIDKPYKYIAISVANINENYVFANSGNNSIIPTWENNKVITWGGNEIGKIIDYNGYCISQIPISKGLGRFEIIGQLPWSVAFYTGIPSETTLIANSKLVHFYANTRYLIPSDAKYMVLCYKDNPSNLLNVYIKVFSDWSLSSRKIIVGIGDSLTAGWSGAIVNNTNFGYLSQLLTKLDNKNDYDYVNLGYGGENTKQICARVGAMPYYFQNDVTFHSDGSATFVGYYGVDGIISSDTNLPIAIARESNFTYPNSGKTLGKLNPCYVSVGDKMIEFEIYIDGQVNVEPTSSSRVFVKPTSVPGRDIVIKAGTTFHCDAEKYLALADVTIIWQGTNGGYNNEQNLIWYNNKIISNLKSNKVIIIGMHTFFSLSDAITMESNMLKEYGSRFFNVRKYMVESGLTDAGLSPTTEDTERIAGGKVPASLLAGNGDYTHFNAIGYGLVADQIKNIGQSLGYW